MQKLFKCHVMRQRDGNVNERLRDMGDIMRSNIYWIWVPEKENSEIRRTVTSVDRWRFSRSDKRAGFLQSYI